METIANIATALSTVVAVGISLVLLRQGQQDRRQARAALNNAHALRVSCWAEWAPDPIPLLSGGLLRAPQVTVANRTDEPVYGTFVDYRDPVDGRTIRKPVGTVPPDSTRSVGVGLPEPPPDPNWEPEHLFPVLYFRDTSNRWWHRNTAGRLTPDAGPVHDGPFEIG